MDGFTKEVEAGYFAAFPSNTGVAHTIINEMALIPFKTKACMEIRKRGEDSKNWKKHRGDVINLAVNFLTEESKEPLSGKVRDHFVDFMNQF